jgi:phospholipid N-methyltransferase
MNRGQEGDSLVTEGGRGTLQFLRGVARSPVQMGAIVPSGKALARAIVAHAQISEGQVVVELGAGSGSFTRELLAQNPKISLTVFEMSVDLAAGLRRDFPRAQVVALPAEDLPKVAAALGILRIDRVVGGLPWALWGESRQAAVLDAIVPFLTPQARMVTFHYVHSRSLGRVATTRRLLQERFEQVTYSEPVWANVPPAFVHISQGVKIRG